MLPSVFIVGLPSSGKSTVAGMLVSKINSSTSYNSFLIDADHLNKFSVLPLPGDFSLEARNARGIHLTNIVQWVNFLNYIPVVAAIGQPPSLMELWQNSIPGFCVVHLNADIQLCKERDYKATYSKQNVVGKDIPYVSPSSPDLKFDVSQVSANYIVDQILLHLSL